jgi:hypothetical protein
LIEQKALAQVTQPSIAVNPCPALIAAFNAAKARLISDVTSNNLRALITDLNAHQSS